MQMEIFGLKKFKKPKCCSYSDCRPAYISRRGRDDEAAKKLWSVSCELLGIQWDWAAQTSSVFLAEPSDASPGKSTAERPPDQNTDGSMGTM